MRTTTHLVNGHQVRFCEIPARRQSVSYKNDASGAPIYKPEERARFEVYVDDHFVAYLCLPIVVGKKAAYRIERLGEPYQGRFQEVTVWGFGVSKAEQLLTLDQAASKVVELRFKRIFDVSGLPTSEELLAHVEAENARRKREKEEEAARIEEIRAQHQREREEAERERIEKLEGLISICERIGDQLTNLEMSALAAAIEDLQ